MDLEEFATLHGLRVKQDLDGTAIIPGKGHSHLYEYDDEVLGVLIMPVPPRSSQSWTRIRASFEAAGMAIRQNGDAEGAATFDPSNRDQVRLALRYAGIKKRRVASPGQIAARNRGLAVIRAARGRSEATTQF